MGGVLHIPYSLSTLVTRNSLFTHLAKCGHFGAPLCQKIQKSNFFFEKGVIFVYGEKCSALQLIKYITDFQ